MMQHKFHQESPMIVIVVSPLNSIMDDQVHSLGSKTKSVRACYVSFDGGAALRFDEEDEETDCSDDDGNGNIVLPKAVRMEDLQNGQFHIIYAHPETLQSRKTRKLLGSRVDRDSVCAVVIDEVHIISEWGGDFRPAFNNLGELTCLFPDVAHLALTATCTTDNIKNLSKVLQYRDSAVVSLNPDRPNIYIEIKTRIPNIHKYQKYDELIQPIVKELSQKLCNFPVTIFYMESLEALGYSYQFLSHYMKEKQYLGESKPENRIFAQYHKDYTSTCTMKAHIVSKLQKPTPKLRLVLATVALGMGLNAPAVTRIIHSRPPTTLEAYMQEIGRAGRQGQCSEAVMYFNNSDISRSRKGLSYDMVSFCRNENQCLKLLLVQHSGFSEILYTGLKANCCSNCRKDSTIQQEIK